MVIVKKKNKLSVDISNNEHSIVSDVAHLLGGDDSGLNPHELLEASLGACTNITIMMYAKRKNWPLEDIETKVVVVKEGEENLITREIKLTGNLDEEQRTQLIAIGNKCPIHKLLGRKTIVETSAV